MSEGPDIAQSPNAATAPAEPAPAPDRGRFLLLAKIAVFDIAGPLVAYSLLRSAGLSAVGALVLSGILPVLGVVLGMARDRRVDVVGVLVLLGIAVGTGLGLASGNARLVLLEGSVPTVVFGAVCLGSLWTRRPLKYRFAVEFIGPDTPKGRDFADRWRYLEFRHAFRVTTVVWGVAFLAEAAARIVIVESTSTGSALGISKVMRYAVAGVLIAWNIAYGRRARRRGPRPRGGPAAHASLGTGLLALGSSSPNWSRSRSAIGYRTAWSGHRSAIGIHSLLARVWSKPQYWAVCRVREPRLARTA